MLLGVVSIDTAEMRGKMFAVFCNTNLLLRRLLIEMHVIAPQHAWVSRDTDQIRLRDMRVCGEVARGAITTLLDAHACIRNTAHSMNIQYDMWHSAWHMALCVVYELHGPIVASDVEQVCRLLLATDHLPKRNTALHFDWQPLFLSGNLFPSF